MALPRRIPKAAKRASRWKSTAHRDFVRSHACCNCGSDVAIEVAHVRIGSGAGMGQKPDDWRCVSLCHECHHSDQHLNGERSFWAAYKLRTGQDVETLLDQFAEASPRAAQIRQAKRERADG
ncbi:MAG: hypothetical protein QM681_20425 [Novosphingobium sp.]